MKVIHLITTIDLGGAERQLAILTKHQVKNGLQVEIIYLKGEGQLLNVFFKNGVKVNSRYANQNVLYQIFKLFFYLNKNADIIHAHLSRCEVFSALLKINSKLIVTKHNSEQLFPKKWKLFSKFLARFVALRADAIITISNAVREFLISIQELNPKKPIHVVYYGYDDNLPSASFKKKIPHKFNFGTVCRLENQKDVRTLLFAWKKYQTFYKHDALKIVGRGSREFELKCLAKSLELKNISWLKTNSNIVKFYSNFDVFILSTFYEGFGLVLLEAMQFKLPILASNNTSVPEVLGVNYLGLVQTQNSDELSLKMLELKSNSMYKKLAKQSAKRLSKFNPSEMAIKILDIYESYI